MSSASSPEALKGLIRDSKPIKKQLIGFVALALIVLNAGHAFDSVRLALSSAERMEINSHFVEMHAIRDHLEHIFTDNRQSGTGTGELAAEVFLNQLRQGEDLKDLSIGQASLLTVDFGDKRQATSSSLSEDQEQSLLRFLGNHSNQNTLPAKGTELMSENIDQFVYADVESDRFLIARAPFMNGDGQIIFAKKSITREIALGDAVQSALAFAAVLFWLGIWFAIVVATFVGRRIDLSNATITAALLSRDDINAELEDIVATRTRALEESKLEAEAASKAKGAFLANMSHEIRTPMNGVLGMAELMAMSDLTEDQHRQLQMITNSSEALLRILDDILDISKIEAGQLQIERTTTRIRDLAESISLAMAPEADKRNVRLSLIFAPEVPEELVSDPVRLRQIFYNLLSNAIKFSASKDADRPGKVLFKIDYLDESILKFRVADNGIGISEEQAKTLFEPFSQAEASTTRRFGGSGLGLSIIKNLVELLGGHIQLESAVGKGTEIVVAIPSKLVKSRTYPGINQPTNLYFLTDRRKSAQSGNVLSWFYEPTNVREFSNEEELCSAILSAQDRVVVGLSLISNEENLAARQRVMKKTSCQDFIVMTEDRSARFGMHPDGYYVATRYPVLYSEIENALTVLLQKPQAEPCTKSKASIEAPKQEKPEDNQERKKILLVEDNEINLVVMTKQLELLGFAPEVARNGREGLQKWIENKFDLVLTDCHMPEMDGFELTREIRDAEQAESLAPSRIIAITANAMDGEAEKWDAAGANAYLSKPTTLEALRNAVFVSDSCRGHGSVS